MEQSRINQLQPLRTALSTIRLAHKAEFKAKLHAINERPFSEQQDARKAEVEYWLKEKKRAIMTFMDTWEKVYGFVYLPRCGCESRIPREEFNFINQG